METALLVQLVFVLAHLRCFQISVQILFCNLGLWSSEAHGPLDLKFADTRIFI